VQVAAKGGSAQLLPNARHAGEGAEKRERSSWEDGNNCRTRRYPAANPSRSRGTNALSRLRSAPTRQGTTRSTPKKIQKCLAMPWRTEEQPLLKVSSDDCKNQAEKPIALRLPRRRGASSSAQGYGVTSRRDMGFHQLMTEFFLGKVFSDWARIITKIKLTSTGTSCQSQRLCDCWLRS
jgi:hypothetical protein